MATVLDHSRISPPLDAASELSIPLLFFDMLWYDVPIWPLVLFYKSNHSKSQFLNDVVPALQHSLSLTLAHFLPLAGNVVYPSNLAKNPTADFVPGLDFVSFTVCESNSDNFDHLTGNHPRDCADFYPLVPELPAFHSHDSIKVPILGIQVTHFPGNGIAIGVAFCHVVVDGSTLVSFVRAWGLISCKKATQLDNAKTLLQEHRLLPFFDRSAFTDINGLDSTYWKLITSRPSSPPSSHWKVPEEKVRSTFVLTRNEIQELKNLVYEQYTGKLTNLSSFSVVCGLVWFCLARSARAGGEEVGDDVPDYFSYVADCRGKPAMSPPLPQNYLGNSLACFWISLKHGELKGGDGFVKAAAFISEAIRKTVHNEKGILQGAEAWLSALQEDFGKRLFWVAGSPKLDWYEVDFGFGRATKTEYLTIDDSASISLSNSRWVKGGLEIGVSKSRDEMKAFTSVFRQFMSYVNVKACKAIPSAL